MKTRRPRFELWHTFATLAAMVVATQVCFIGMMFLQIYPESEPKSGPAPLWVIVTGGAMLTFGLVAIVYLLRQLYIQVSLLFCKR